MTTLIAELRRLYALPGQTLPDPSAAAEGGGDLVGPDGQVRTVVVGLAGAAAWPAVAALCEGVEAELELPAPAVSVAGAAGFRVWFSLASAVPLARAVAFGDGLCRRFLAELPAAHVDLLPTPAGRGALPAVPAAEGATGRWTAFIDPALGGMFADEPWLAMAPNPERQADLLAGFASIAAADFERVMAMLGAAAAVSPAAAGPAAGGAFSDPKGFLLAVMNDPGVSLAQRIEAARVLLPYFERAP